MNLDYTPHLPIARLRHIRPGQDVVLLIREPCTGKVLRSKPATLERTDAYYGYLSNRDKVSLCHPVATDKMIFAEHGWMVK